MKRVGHGGTLDPARRRTAAVLFGTGNAAQQPHRGLAKGYGQEILLGTVTNTLDMERHGPGDQDNGPRLQTKLLREIIPEFIGEIRRFAADYSAPEHQGAQRLYEIAPRGRRLNASPRR